MLEVKDLCAGYPGRKVLKDVALTVPAGKVTVLLGPNGCGKTTLLKVLCGILPADSGTVLLDGAPLLRLPGRQLARKVAYLAQGHQVPDITVQRLVLHGRFPYLGYPRRYRKQDYAIAQAAMEQMGVRELADTLLENLSGGQQQKAYIAMNLAQDTPVVLLDEPTTYLDIAHQLQLLQLAQQLARQGKGVLMILHDLPHAFRTADRLVLMRAGTVVAEGTPEELFTGGTVNGVFGVKLARVATDTGWHYYCEEAQA